jgi:hypothetical protein
VKKVVVGTLAHLLIASPTLAEISFSQGFLTFEGNPQVNLQLPYNEVESDWSEVEGDGFDRFETTLGDTVYEVEFVRLVNDGFSVAQACAPYEGSNNAGCQVINNNTFFLLTVDRTENFRWSGVTRQLETGEVLRIIVSRSGANPSQEELTNDLQTLQQVLGTVRVLR